MDARAGNMTACVPAVLLQASAFADPISMPLSPESISHRNLRCALLIPFLLSMPAGYTSPVWAAQPEASEALKFIEAVKPVAVDARRVQLAPRYGGKFATAPSKFTHTVTNPYLDSAGLFFAKMDAIRCTADGGLLITGRAGLDASFNALATGAWKAAPDGSVRALHVRTTKPQGSAARPA
jgi:hypothetical protein